MDRHSIITLPHAHLRQKSGRVSTIDEDVQTTIKNMKEATLDWEAHRNHEFGVALAAVQIDVLKRIVIVRNDFENKEDHRFTVLINPQIIRYEGEIVEDFEGCLSIKDIYGKVPRHTKVKVKAEDINGREIRIVAEGFLARVMQHEIDHTRGILFIDHIKEKDSFYQLNLEGKLEKLAYDGIAASRILWE